ncbi:MAG: MBL fold metallo-hydrolase [Steroidobacteraceae bacterium]|nr:MBL fold metallo-hydrolase [Steroidobacteraceae bacterium]
MQKSFAKLLGLATGAYATRRSLRGGPGYRGPPSDHFNGSTFFNPDASAGKSFSEFLRWQRTSQATPWPQWVENRAVPCLPEALQPGEIALTFINHITYLLQFRGLNLLTDPVYSERVSPVQWSGPRRVRAPGLAFESLPRIDVVLVSHNHYDHLDLDTLKRLENDHRPLFLTGLGNRAFLQEHGLGQVREFDWWDEASHGDARLTYTPAQHWSGRGVSGRNRTLWGGFVIEADGRKVFFAGDTGYWKHFGDLRGRLGVMDLALLPIGAYEPRWFMGEQHMNPEEAVRAHLDLEAKLSIGTHYGCFQLTDEGIDEPLHALDAARRRHGVAETRFRALETGETLRING